MLSKWLLLISKRSKEEKGKTSKKSKGKKSDSKKEKDLSDEWAISIGKLFILCLSDSEVFISKK
jgi:hypothetical protein